MQTRVRGGGVVSRGIIVIFYNFNWKEQEERRKRGEIIKVDWIFSCGKCSVTAARQPAPSSLQPTTTNPPSMPLVLLITVCVCVCARA